MKIAITALADIPDGGAVAHRILMMGKGLVSLGHEVHVVVPYKFSAGPLIDELDGVKVHWGTSISKEASQTFWGKIRKKLILLKNSRNLIINGLDWLILYQLGIDGLLFLPVARRYRCKIASDNCDLRYLPDNPSIQQIYTVFMQKFVDLFITPYFDLHIAISNYLENSLRRVAPHVPRVIVPALVDVDEFRARNKEAKAFRAERGLRNTTVIGFLGSRFAVKGLQILLEASHKLLREGKDFRLLITGDAATNPQLLRLIEELELTDRVALTGYLPKDQLITAMSAVDIFVEPKIEHEANLAAFPQKLVEYLSMGKPIVASAIGDISQYLRDQENALLVKAGDAVGLAAALKRLMEDRGLRQRLARGARETAEENFDCRILAKRLETGFNMIQCS